MPPGASEFGHLEIVQLLLERGAVVDEATSPQGMTALHWAALKGRVDCIKELCIRGANVNYIASDGKTPFDKSPDRESREALQLYGGEPSPP